MAFLVHLLPFKFKTVAYSGQYIWCDTENIGDKDVDSK